MRFRGEAIVVLIAMTMGGCDSWDRSAPAGEVEAEAVASSGAAEGPASGRELFAVCSTCHGTEGRGTQLAPPLTGPEWIHIQGGQEEIERIIREGVATPREYPIPMPPLGGGDFDAEEIRSLAAYVVSLGAG